MEKEADLMPDKKLKLELPEPPVASLHHALPHLRRPFAAEALKFRPAPGSLVLPYIDARVVVERFNAVIPRWESSYELVPGSKNVLCHLTIDGVTRSDVGTMSSGPNVDPLKGGYSDALKRAAVHFGVGVSVYALQKIRTTDLSDGDFKPSGKSFILTDKGLRNLRAGYRKWLKNTGVGAFGEPLAHGDVEDAVGDPEAEPTREAGGTEAPEQPSLEVEAEKQEIRDLYDAIPAAKRRGKMTPAKFGQKLKAATDQGNDALAKLRAEIEEMGK
jgi:hypothetical protein